MYAITIALFHKILGKNPGPISEALLEYANEFNQYEIDFPASCEDYVTFDRLNDGIALNILYVPLNEVNICPEYISKRNFDKKLPGSTIRNWGDNGIFQRFQMILMKMVS